MKVGVGVSNLHATEYAADYLLCYVLSSLSRLGTNLSVALVMHCVGWCLECLARFPCRHCPSMQVATTWLGGTAWSAIAASGPGKELE